MAKRDQQELPNTRRDDEPPPFKPIRALDDCIAEGEKLKGKRSKIGQEINANAIKQQELLVKHELASYPYETANGAEREIYRTEQVKSRKIKTKAETEPGKKPRRGRAKSEEAGADQPGDDE